MNFRKLEEFYILIILGNYINLIYIFFIGKVKFKNYKQKTASSPSVAGKEEKMDSAFHCTAIFVITYPLYQVGFVFGFEITRFHFNDRRLMFHSINEVCCFMCILQTFAQNIW